MPDRVDEAGAKRLMMRDWPMPLGVIAKEEVQFVARAGAGAKKLIMHDCRVPFFVISAEERLAMCSHC